MGKSILKCKFDKADFEEFSHRLEQETSLLQEWCKGGIFNTQSEESGFELELWLLNSDLQPTSGNHSFIKKSKSNLLIAEVVQSSLEVNMQSDVLHNRVLAQHYDRLNNIFNLCEQEAAEENQHIIAIGTLPTATPEDFTQFNLTDENRYHAINQRLQELRNHHPLHLHIEGNEILDMPIDCVSVAGAVSSFQIHFRTAYSKSARLYNASVVLSAPMVALSANSPFLFGRCLWEESRIPFYEQVLKTERQLDRLPRVTFGEGYIKNSLIDLFVENNRRYAPFIPQVMDVPEENLFHLKLHNGNIYRWNRPVIDFDQHSVPHFRVEHRPISAGPAMVDMIANAAFYYGVTFYHANTKELLEEEISFNSAKNNFYYAAKNGLDTEIIWLKNKKINIAELILKILLPQAKEGLRQLDIDPLDIEYYLSIIEERVQKKKTGSQWQKEFLKNNNGDFALLVKRYLELQKSGMPVHNWSTK